MSSLIDRLVLWVKNEHGSPGSVPTRYACEFGFPVHPEVADMRIAVRQAFLDGMAFNAALVDAADRRAMG